MRRVKKEIAGKSNKLSPEPSKGVRSKSNSPGPKKRAGKAKTTAKPEVVDPGSPSSSSSLANNPVNLSQFKYEKRNHPITPEKAQRPHITIEYDKEKESPVKQESQGLWKPPHWEEFLLNLRNMRANHDAPVDSMGCHMAMDEKAPPEIMRYQSLIALMLSSQTKDQVTFEAMQRLRARGLTVDNILNMSDEELGQLIYPVGFWKTKVKYIKKTTQTLKEQYNGDIPNTAEKLCKLTGVGPKMAHICMSVAWNKVTGIGVDTHVHRISNRIGWVRKPTATPEDTRKALETWLPYDLWAEVNHLMVGFGQTICLPIGPSCDECLNWDICPSSEKGKVKKSPKKTPVKKEIMKELSDSEEFEVKKEFSDTKKKLPRVRKDKPKKEAGDQMDGEAKQMLNVIESHNAYLTVPQVPLKISPRKRRVTQKKEIKEKDLYKNSEIIKNVQTENIAAKISPKKRRVTPKKSDANTTSNEIVDEGAVVPKSTRNSSPRNQNTSDTSESGEKIVVAVKRTRAKKQEL